MGRMRQQGGLVAILGFWALCFVSTSFAQTLEGQIFPPLRTVQSDPTVQTLASAFLTITNTRAATAGNDARGCTIQPQTLPPGTSFLSVQVVPATSEFIGPINGPYTIAGGSSTKFNVTFVINPRVSFLPTMVSFNILCANRPSATVLNTTGLDAITIAASTIPRSSIAALTSTPNDDVELPTTRATIPFLIASINLGATDFMTLSVDTTGVPVQTLVCRFDVATGTCVDPPSLTVPQTIGTGVVNFWAVFVVGQGTPIVVDPNTAIFVQWEGSDNVVRGLLRVTVHSL